MRLSEVGNEMSNCANESQMLEMRLDWRRSLCGLPSKGLGVRVRDYIFISRILRFFFLFFFNAGET